LENDMQIGTVVGHARATVKHPSMNGWKLLLVQYYLADGRTPDGDPLLAVDSLGAGLGEKVLLTSDGRSTREMLGSDNTPVRWNVQGIVD